MVADVAEFSEAVDRVYKTFSTQEVSLDRKEMKGMGERGMLQYVEQKFQQQLQRARGAMLQEFRNHSVVVESEVRRIRDELTERLEEKYGSIIAGLKRHAEECDRLVARHKDEIQHLKGLATAQEAYLTAVRHRWGLEQRERLLAEIQALREDLDASRRDAEDLSHQLLCRDELVAQLRNELAALEAELKRQGAAFAEEKRVYDERLRGLRLEMRQQQDQFKEHLRNYEEKFAEYRDKTNEELQIQGILNSRRSEALNLMEEERQRHIKARTKPTPRIGQQAEEVVEEGGDAAAAPTVKGVRYRVDEMGMDTGWHDYHVDELPLVPLLQHQQLHGRKTRPPPNFHAGRIAATRRAISNPVAGHLGQHAPTSPQVLLPTAGRLKDSSPRPVPLVGAAVLTPTPL